MAKSKKNEKPAKVEEPAAAGHNSQSVSGARIKSFVERIERLTSEQKALGDDIKDVYSEAKATGFETKILRKIVAKRKMSLEARREEEELLELYETAMSQGDLFAKDEA